MSPAQIRPWTPQRLVVLGAIWVATLANWPLWQILWALPELGLRNRLALTLAMTLAIAGLLATLLAAFAWRPSVRPALAFVVLSAALTAHFMGAYGIVINPSMMRNVLQTDVREVRDLVGMGILISVMLLAVLPLWWLWRRPVTRLTWKSAALRNAMLMVGGLAVCVAALFATFADFASLMRNHPDLRYRINPLNVYYSLANQMLPSSNAPDRGPPEPVASDAHLAPLLPGQRPRLLLLVIGETARADRFEQNGYGRPTTPELVRAGSVSFAEVSACGTDTASSLPCMFSLLEREAFVARQRPQENLLDALYRAGLAVLWLDNQSGCKNLCARVPDAFAHTPAAAAPPMPPGLCNGHECFDEALLHGLDQRLAALPDERVARGVVLVLHQMGSHGPAYHLRTPSAFKRFVPECTATSLQNCDRAALNNAFDNTIAYTDHVLARSIDWLGAQRKRFDPALLYVSDHGESLGENNLFLHGMPFRFAPREQTHVPWIVWWPAQTEASSGTTLACLQARSSSPLTHSHLSHTVLAWMGVQTASYRRDLDAFAACRQPAPQ